MSHRHASLLLSTLAALFSAAASAEAPRPSLDEVLPQATAIAVGQVEQIDGRRGRPLVTFKVEHVARGELPDVVTFYADPVRQHRLSVVIGRRFVAFLEPAHQEGPALQLVSAGAGALLIISEKNESYVASTRYSGLTLPAKLCDSSVPKGLGECLVRLAPFLRQTGLAPLKPAKGKIATFRRFLPRECEPCQLEDQLAKSVAPGGLDCGASTLGKDSSELLRCVREALLKKKAFCATVPKRGVDSQLVDAFVSDGTRIHRVDFDSSIEGGPKCAAVVSRLACESLEFPEGGNEQIHCVNPSTPEVLCSQVATRVEKVSAPEEVSKLRCAEKKKGGRYNDCASQESGDGQRKIIPPANGPDLLCSSGPWGLSCSPV